MEKDRMTSLLVVDRNNDWCLGMLPGLDHSLDGVPGNQGLIAKKEEGALHTRIQGLYACSNRGALPLFKIGIVDEAQSIDHTMPADLRSCVTQHEHPLGEAHASDQVQDVLDQRPPFVGQELLDASHPGRTSSSQNDCPNGLFSGHRICQFMSFAHITYEVTSAVMPACVCSEQCRRY